jgi:CMP-N-acetylneuraminic acid synthetase
MEVVLLNKKILAIIPARSGSKRLPNKNMLSLSGKPLIQWTIEAALLVDEIDDVIVSTDSEDIAKFAKLQGAKVPFLRPDNISGDTATSVDVAENAINFFKKLGVTYEYILLLQPTSPLRKAEHIEEAIVLQKTHLASGVVSVCECEHSPLWTNTLDESLSMDNFLTDFVKNNTRSQDLATYYRLNGAIYLVNTESFLKEKNLFLSENLLAYKMSLEDSIDIDNLMDFKLADLIMNEKNKIFT